jgi:hypothetical protein
LAKTSFNSASSTTTQVESLTVETFTYKAGSQGRGNATTKASMIEVGTSISLGVETFFLLQQTKAPVITLGGVKNV